MSTEFFPVRSELLFSRDPQNDPRLGDLVKRFSGTENPKGSVVIAGYPDDEGILNNGGRPGSAEGPDRIRHYLYRMTPALKNTTAPTIYDIGNLAIENHGLERRHEVAKEKIVSLLKKGARWIALGGGHDYGFPDGAALSEVSGGEKPLIINFDAHLDVRSFNTNINSGTPFSRLLTFYPQIDFFEIGIQSQCNSKNHYNWAKSKGAHILTMADITISGKSPTQKILEFLEPHLLKRRPTFISLDIDCFSSTFAPGCSQSWPLGLTPHDLLPVLEVLYRRQDVKILGVYEVSPPLDVADQTSKLAAELIHHFIFTAQ